MFPPKGVTSVEALNVQRHDGHLWYSYRHSRQRGSAGRDGNQQHLLPTPNRTSRRSTPNWSSPCDRWARLSRFQVGNPGFQSCRSVTFGHTSSFGVPSSLAPKGQGETGTGTGGCHTLTHDHPQEFRAAWRQGGRGDRGGCHTHTICSRSCYTTLHQCRSLHTKKRLLLMPKIIARASKPPSCFRLVPKEWK